MIDFYTLGILVDAILQPVILPTVIIATVVFVLYAVYELLYAIFMDEETGIRIKNVLGVAAIAGFFGLLVIAKWKEWW